MGCLSVLLIFYQASLRAKGLKGNEQTGSHGTFHDLVFKVVHCHLHFILSVKIESLSPAFTQGEGN